MSPDLLTTQQAADRRCVADNPTRRWCRQGTVGRAVAIEDIQRWVAERRAKGLNVDYWTALLCMRSLEA